MTYRIDVDVRISLPVPRRSTHTTKMAVTAHTQAAAQRVADRAGLDLADLEGMVITVQPPQLRKYPDAPPAGADSQAADPSPPADHLPGAGDADTGSSRDRLDAGGDDSQVAA